MPRRGKVHIKIGHDVHQLVLEKERSGCSSCSIQNIICIPMGQTQDRPFCDVLRRQVDDWGEFPGAHFELKPYPMCDKVE
ncbi:MAG: hypothetical protein IJ190_00950 [Prevotella sp.]|nr:hypothetical protein [Prevotella sp.]